MITTTKIKGKMGKRLKIKEMMKMDRGRDRGLGRKV